MKKLLLALCVLSVPLAAQQVVPLRSGETAIVTCDAQALETTVTTTTRTDLRCVPVPPPPPTRPVPLPTGNSDNMRYWHVAGPHDGLNPHEHGDAPPDWVNAWSLSQLGSAQLFGWQPVMTNNENYMKHQAYKGGLGTIGPFTSYILVHAQSNPLDWMAPYHSGRLWVRYNGEVVEYRQVRVWSGWIDVRSHRLRRMEEQRDSLYPGWPGRGSFALSCISRQDGSQFASTEQWYMTSGFRGYDLGLSIGRNAAFCDPDRMPTMEQAMDFGTWDPTGYHGTNRRFELTVFGPKSYAPRPRYTGWWCYQIQPSEPQHSHTSMPTWDAYAPAEGPNQCRAGYAAQYTSPNMPETGIDFRLGNAFERRYSDAGLAQPQ